MKLQIHLDTGALIEVDADSFATQKDRATQHINHLEWTTPDGWLSKLHSVDLDRIVAIVAVRDAKEARQ